MAANVLQPAPARSLHQLLEELRKLPLFPTTVQQALAVTQKESASFKELCEILETDVMVAVSILKLANSPLYSWGQSIDTLDQAVVRLGMRECHNLIVAVSMRSVFHQADPGTKGLCSVLWNHSFLTACLCRRLNRELRFDFHGEEFTAGLLHDLGRILLAITMPGEFQAA
ncbi:MAG TPA: HDOD domain-containing protein, partial [Gemmataceae bacterium]|nr:HDOD domain-containing protein [Gemmataceae bacterium]